MNKMFFLVITLPILFSCSSTTLKPQKTISETAYEYIQPKYGSINRAVENLIGYIAKPEIIDDIVSYDSTKGFQPIRSFKYSEMEAFQKYVIEICEAENGKMDISHSMCFDSNKIPVFYAKITATTIQVYEKLDKTNQKNWEKYLEDKKLFTTQITKKAIEKEYLLQKQLDVIQQKKEELLRKKQNEEISKAPIGTQICKNKYSAVRLIGFIEARSNNRIKVLVNYIADDYGMKYDNEFQNYYTWDDQYSWYVCNLIRR